MLLSFFQRSLIMLFLLAFISQASASSLMSVRMILMSNDMTTMVHTMDSQQMTSMQQDHTDGDMSDKQQCCQQNCHCSVNGCAFTALISDATIQQALIDSMDAIHFPLLINNNQYPKSLYRPPIQG